MALVQSPTMTMPMLQTRPSSQEPFQSQAPVQPHQRYSVIPRTMQNTSSSGMPAGSYRGQTTAPSVAPYAFQPTQRLQHGQNPLGQHPTGTAPPPTGSRTTSAPVVPMLQPNNQGIAPSSRPRPPAVNAGSTPLNSSYSGPWPGQGQGGLKESPTITQLPAVHNSQSLPPLNLNPPAMTYATVAKSSPDRYRRTQRRPETGGTYSGNNSMHGGSALPSGSGMATVGHLYNHPTQTSSTPALNTYPSYHGASTPSPASGKDHDPRSQQRTASKDDLNVQRQSSSDLAKRYRRRSISSLEAKDYVSEAPPASPAQQRTYAEMLAGPAPSDRRGSRSPVTERPTSSHGRQASNESSTSGRSSSRPASAKRGPEISTSIQQVTPIAKNEAKVVNVPARGSSEANKRLAHPSPLSQPMSMSPEQPSSNDAFAPPLTPPSLQPVTQNGIPESPAAQQLAALNKKEGKKEGKSSRLRRAFSFGSAAELRKASAENSAANNIATNERAKLRKDRYADENEAKQAAIAQQQEAAGLGEGIYSGQGNFLTGSTDNLSISSTASSASVMIRKMGKGMKKGSRSLVGLFRPKSVVGVPAADGPVPEASIAQVSMVTVEAEREKVNVNVNPHDQAGGGTGFPKLERNSLDAASAAPDLAPAFSDRDSLRGRRSIVGGEKERAEVLAAVKKGILKRTDSGNSSPVVKPADSKVSDFSLPPVQRLSESPRSSSPATPTGHRRTDSVQLEGEEYYFSLQNFANSGESKSAPGTPRGTAERRGVTFGSSIRFHETWPSGEYDRRGEIATCNRLTPMLAQQIKEELNTFKMEMEVHTESKVYTHFF